MIQINGHPAIRFQEGELLTFLSAWAKPDSQTVLAVASSSSVNNDTGFLLGSSTVRAAYASFSSGFDARPQIFKTSDWAARWGSTVSGWSAWSWGWDESGGSVTAHVQVDDGTPVDSASYTLEAADNWTGIGGGGSGTTDYLLTEILVVSDYRTDEQYTDWLAYVADRYGL